MSWRDTIVDETEQSAEEQQETAPRSSWRDTIVDETPEMAESSAEDVIMQGGPAAISTVESAGRGLGQGLAMSFSDELGGAIQSGLDKTAGLFGESPSEVNARLAAEGFTGDVGPTTSSEMYTSARDENRAADMAAAEANPYTYRGSELFGSLLSGIGAGGAAASRLGLKEGAKLFSKQGLSNVGKLGTIGAVEGGIQGAGISEGQTAGEVLSDAGSGAALGAIVGGALPIAGAVAGSTAKALGTMGTAGAALGGTTGYLTADEDATPLETLEQTAKGAGIGATAGFGAGVLSKYAGKLGKVSGELPARLKESFGRGFKGELIGTDEAIQTSKNVLEEKAQKIAQNIADKSDSAILKIKRAEANFLKKQEDVANAINTTEKAAANKEFEKEGARLTSLIKTSKDKFGKAVNDSYKALEDSSMKYDATNVLNESLRNIENLKGPVGSFQEQSIQGLIDSIVESRSSFTGDVMDARKLRSTIDTLISGDVPSNVKRVLAETRRSINDDISKQAKEQGLGAIADGLTAANKGYHSASLVDIFTGARPGKAELVGSREARATKKLAQLSEPDQQVGSNAQILENALRELAPEQADDIIQRAKAIAVAKSRISGVSKQDIKLAYAEELKTASQKALSQGEAAAKDSEALLGKQVRLTDRAEPSKGMLDFLEMEAAGEANRVAPITEKLVKVAETDAEKVAIEEAKKAAKELDFQKSASGKSIRTVATNPFQQIMATVGGLSEAAGMTVANVAGYAAGDIAKLPSRILRSKPSQIAINAMEKATPEQVKQAAAVVAQTAPDASRKMLNLAATSDPVKRRAIMFMLGQDSQFRQAMDQEDEMNMEGTVVTPNEE